jgi:two-component system, NarL family, response regulator NreC
MEQKKYVRVLIADDHSLFRNGIISMFNANSEILIVGEAENGQEVLNKYFGLKPDVVLLDISMPGMSGFEVLKKLLETDKKVKVLFLTMYGSDDYIYNTIKAGGLGLVNKNILKGELIYAITKVANNHFYFGANWDTEKIEKLMQHHKESEKKSLNYSYTLLTKREKDILKFIAMGLTSRQISNKLNIGKRTIDFYRSSIMQKMNVKTLAELIKFSIDFSSSLKTPTKA